jgi:hypothetical protein
LLPWSLRPGFAVGRVNFRGNLTPKLAFPFELETRARIRSGVRLA